MFLLFCFVFCLFVCPFFLRSSDDNVDGEFLFAYDACFIIHLFSRFLTIFAVEGWSACHLVVFQICSLLVTLTLEQDTCGKYLKSVRD